MRASAKKASSAKKSEGGRPTKFRPEFVTQAQKLAARGFTDQQIADFFEINVLTIHRWKQSNEPFCNALKRGKEVADAMVEAGLFSRATGYSYPSVKIFQGKGADQKPVLVPYTEHVAPDVTAQIFWLKNRKPSEWRDRMEHTGPAGEPIQFIMQNRPAKEN